MRWALLDQIRELGLENNTYIIFTSDNGARTEVSLRRTVFDPPDMTPDREIQINYELSLQYPSRNYPLIGGKQSLFEGGIRVPFIVKGPGVKAGSQCNVPVTGWDILPTLSDMANNPRSLPEEIDGGSFK